MKFDDGIQYLMVYHTYFWIRSYWEVARFSKPITIFIHSWIECVFKDRNEESTTENRVEKYHIELKLWTFEHVKTLHIFLRNRHRVFRSLTRALNQGKYKWHFTLISFFFNKTSYLFGQNSFSWQVRTCLNLLGLVRKSSHKKKSWACAQWL